MAKILIVDDAPTTRQLLKIIVEGAGHEVVGSADNGLDALKLARDLAPDVMLLDMLLPQLDGVEVLGRLGPQRPRVIMLSSVTSTEKISAARDAGLNYYVLKPFTPEKVIETLDKALAGEKR